MTILERKLLVALCLVIENRGWSSDYSFGEDFIKLLRLYRAEINAYGWGEDK